MNNEESTTKKYKGGELSEIIMISLCPFLEKLKTKGLKEVVCNLIPGLDMDNLVLSKIKNQLFKRRAIELGFRLGRVDIQYRHDGIQIEPAGVLRLLIKKITITDSQILESFHCILSQIEDKYISNSDYIANKIDDIIVNLSGTEIYKPKTSEEKTLYDVALLILLNHYEHTNDIPEWMEYAVANISKGEFVSSWIEFLVDYISEIIAQVSENIFFNFKVTFDSIVIRAILNKKTNRGQISSLITLLNINIKEIIYGFSKSYVSPSFIKGTSEILADIAGNFLSSVNKECEKNKNIQPKDDSAFENIFGITVSFAPDSRHGRAFRWYSKENIRKCFIKYSYDENFKNFEVCAAECQTVNKTIPEINLGLTAGYKVIKLNKHSVCLNELNTGKFYYKICSEEGFESKTYATEIRNAEKEVEFVVFADSQGMVKQDYCVFHKLAEKAFENTPQADFMVHLGDFVDDGNNEEYWKWALDCDIWKENVCVAVSGNHEARRNAVALKAGVENSIISHFNFPKIPAQNVSSGAYYSFKYGNAEFVVLNTNAGESGGGISDAQYKWALHTLKKSDAMWKIILTHKTPYSNGPHCKDPDVKKMGVQIMDLAYETEADLILGGHDHVYARTPILAQGKKVGCERRIKENFGGKYINFINPYGNIFVIPGTSGVKNYKQNISVKFPWECMLDLNAPVYSSIKIVDSRLCFDAYLFDLPSEKFKRIDSFSIEKKEKAAGEADSAYVMGLINAVPDTPWKNHGAAIEKAYKFYCELDYREKIKVKNCEKLFTAMEFNKSYLKIIKSEIRRVKTKNEFINAVKDSNVGTIIADFDEIKFKSRKITINRPLCIRGSGKLCFVRFVLKEKAMLILCDNICVDNTRKMTSLLFSADIFEMQSSSVLIVNDNVSLNCGYGLGTKGRAVNINGENCAVYLSGSSCNYVSRGFLHSSNSTSKITINSGKYLSSAKNLTFVLNCACFINGGFIRSIKAGENSCIQARGGIIGEENRPHFNVPIESSGKIIFKSGEIRAKNGVSVIMNNPENSSFVCSTNSLDCIDIKGKIIYNQ